MRGQPRPNVPGIDPASLWPLHWHRTPATGALMFYFQIPDSFFTSMNADIANSRS